MDSEAMMALSLRCEAAPEGEQQNMLIAARNAIRGPQPQIRVPFQADGSAWPVDGIGPYTPEWRAWQASATKFANLLKVEAWLDAALTLVPDGAFWSITMRGENRGGFHACCQLQGDLDWREAATAPLAICAASLRARALAAGEG